MTVTRVPLTDHRGFAAKWPVIDRRPYAVSDANDSLADELHRYLNDQVRGRSFLIAGHRGAGKTFLVRNAVERAHLEIFKDADIAIKAGQADPAWPNLQRPLLVQIHGPSLLAPSKDHAGRYSKDILARCIAQVTTSLYRAVVEEYCAAFAHHAGDLPRPRQAGRMEMAAQLRLDLDMGAEPARLREYWHRFGRLVPGILWPDAIGQARGPGQGAAEIVALASAAQAFQICAGELKLKKSATDGAKREASLEVSAQASIATPPSDALGDFSDKLFALAAGGTAAAAAWDTQSPALAGLAGLTAAVTTAFGLKFAGNRSLNSARSTAYEFLPDTSLETLDRDLPLIIYRLRKAGLAPVFVIDELDKLAPGQECETFMARLTERLKLLTTDHGFFCFLTDRAFYEYVRRRATANGYAREHTTFSNRLLVSYAPSDFRDYAHQLLVPPTGAAEELERDILLGQLMHRSRLNFIDFIRLLDKSLPPPGRRIS